jgi:hypothetical protein
MMSSIKLIGGFLSLLAMSIIFIELFFDINVNKWILSLAYLVLAAMIIYTTKEYQRNKARKK